MADATSSTPLRDQKRCVKKTWFQRVFDWITQRNGTPDRPHVRGLSPHLARDIGLSEAEMARHRHRWPSQTTHHPRG